MMRGPPSGKVSTWSYNARPAVSSASNSRFRKEVRVLREKRDVLNHRGVHAGPASPLEKAAAYFARERHGTVGCLINR
jgi:hypothetical protein